MRVMGFLGFTSLLLSAERHAIEPGRFPAPFNGMGRFAHDFAFPFLRLFMQSSVPDWSPLG
jgi:hypothetical protein